MTIKDKIESLIKYKKSIENSLSSPVPPKHLKHPTTYKSFLEKELFDVTSKINELKGL